MMSDTHRGYDAIVIGSGFGGAFAAHALVNAGWRVLMLERGDWVPRGPHNQAVDGTLDHTPFYSRETPYQGIEGSQTPVFGSASCVGGGSVFYGGVSLRLRPADFLPKPEIADGLRWPFGYAELAPHYDTVERLLEVAGLAGSDPHEPPRQDGYPQAAAPLGETSAMIAAAGRRLGLSPFPLPLAIHYGNDRRGCQLCPTCDTFACAFSAKNDLATTLIPAALRRGLELRTSTVATRLVERDGRVVAVEAIDKRAGARVRFEGANVILAAGALASPHLLMASGLVDKNPAADAVGRFLTRHCNGIAVGVFPRLPDRGLRFHKQIGFHDFYFGHPNGGSPRGKLGAIQQLQTPPIALVRDHAPRWTWPLLNHAVPHTTGLLVLAEDQPRRENGLSIDGRRSDVFGLPQLVVRHRYTERDRAARAALLREARRILWAAGARFFYTYHIKTFSHAAGTLRCGEDPRSAPLDPACRFRGLANLFVTDGSFMPTPGGVNPSLTIAANALRVAEGLAQGTLPPIEGAG